MSDPAIGPAYADTRARITELVRDLPPARAEREAPACPGWRVTDVLAHVVGVCDDIVAGRLDGVATDPWTDAQVSARRDRTTTELVAEWDETAPQVEAIAGDFGPAGQQLLADVSTHEHDLRGALGEAGARDSAAWRIGVEFMTTNFGAALVGNGFPALEVRTADRTWSFGDGDRNTLELPEFELGRAVSGRRSPAQIRAYEWSADPTPYLGAFTWGPFTTRADDLVE